MAIQNRELTKEYFKTGKVPTEQQYGHWIDSAMFVEDQNSGSMEFTGSILLTGSLTQTGQLIATAGSGDPQLSSIIAIGNITSSVGVRAVTLQSSGPTTVGGTLTAPTIEGTNISASIVTASQFNIPSGSGTPVLKWLGVENSVLHNYIRLGSSSLILRVESAETQFTDNSPSNIPRVIIGSNPTSLWGGDKTDNKLNISGSLYLNSAASGHITASGTISASGDLLTSCITRAASHRFIDNNVYIADGGSDLDIVGGGLNADGNITASGTISASIVIATSLTATTATINGGTSSFDQLETTNFIGSRPIQTKTSNVTLALADAGTYNRCGSHIITIPLNSSVAFATGTEIEFIQTSSAGHLFINSGSNSVDLNSRHSLFSASGEFSAISIKKVGTDEWDIIGDLIA